MFVANHAESADADVCDLMGPRRMDSSEIAHDIGENESLVSSLIRKHFAEDRFQTRVAKKMIPVQPRGTVF